MGEEDAGSRVRDGVRRPLGRDDGRGLDDGETRLRGREGDPGRALRRRRALAVVGREQRLDRVGVPVGQRQQLAPQCRQFLAGGRQRRPLARPLRLRQRVDAHHLAEGGPGRADHRGRRPARGDHPFGSDGVEERAIGCSS
nr:hypothetical protein [Halogeometricum sp. CBA1124]